MCWARKSPSLIVNTGGYQPQKCPDEIHTSGTWADRYVPHSILPQAYAFGSSQCGCRITPNTGCINFQPKIFLGQICHIHASFTQTQRVKVRASASPELVAGTPACVVLLASTTQPPKTTTSPELNFESRRSQFNHYRCKHAMAMGHGGPNHQLLTCP